MEKKILFIDETGDYNLFKIDKTYPILGLLGVIFDEDYHFTEVEGAIRNLKYNFGLESSVILHTAEIVRCKNCFVFLKNAKIRESFYKAIDDLLLNLEYTIIFVVVNKMNFIKTYRNPYDPYCISLKFMEERFYYYLRGLSLNKSDFKGKIIVESRDDKLDDVIIAEQDKIFNFGTEHISPSDFNETIINFKLKNKMENIAGLQVADLIASQLGRKHLGFRPYWGDNLDVKFRKGPNGGILGYGLKIFPK
ncbi:MAG: DUF3800 domain-containing protein [Candidatus Atribacteria bacterium]|nr:DUF3800 domain-containing protein [Candidatus Atribacteria bacterium]